MIDKESEEMNDKQIKQTEGQTKKGNIEMNDKKTSRQTKQIEE
jgi:hypothetical protein